VAQAAVTTNDRTPAPPSPPTGAGRGASPASVLKWVVRQRETTVITITVLTIVYFSVRTSAVYTVDNLIVTMQYVAPIIVIGAGETLMLVLGEIDLSAGQVYLTAPWFVYWFWSSGVPVGWAMALALVLSALIGVVNGLVTVWLGVPSLIVTLAMTFLLYGLVLVGSSYTQAQMTWTRGTPPAAPVQTPPCHGYPLPASCVHAPSWSHPSPYFYYSNILGIGSWATICWGVLVLALIWFLLKHTRFGVHTTATGGNILAAAESGIPVARVKIWCFIIISTASGFIGVLDLIRLGSMDPGDYGLDIVLPPIVAAVIGGTALTGGRGTVLGTLIGALFLGILEDGLNLTGVSANWFFLLQGIIILVAMIINVQLGRFSMRFRR
jgi:simple sugar transport system permease protein